MQCNLAMKEAMFKQCNNFVFCWAIYHIFIDKAIELVYINIRVKVIEIVGQLEPKGVN